MGFKRAARNIMLGSEFTKSSDQQEQVGRLTSSFFGHFKQQLDKVMNMEIMSVATVANLELMRWSRDPYTWLDLGSGDGSMTSKILEGYEKSGLCMLPYEGIEPDPVFREQSGERLAAYSTYIHDGDGFNGTMHEGERRQIVSGFNSLYFVQDFDAFAEDLQKTLLPMGIGVFVQNKLFTDKAKEALEKTGGKVYTAHVPVENFFPELSEEGWTLITGRASEADIRAQRVDEADAIMKTKHIIESMGGISTETEEGQKKAVDIRERIEGGEYGGPGKYVSDNYMLVYVPPYGPNIMQHIAENAVKAAQRDVSAQIAK